MTQCRQCGRDIPPESLRRVFCCRACADAWYRGHKDRHYIPHEEPRPGDRVLREFDCRQCGRRVLVVDPADRRSVFCQQPCERKYWREVTRHRSRGREGNRGMSGGMSIGALIRRERRDLD